MRRNWYTVPFDQSDITAPFHYHGQDFAGIADLWNRHMFDYAHHFHAANTLVFRSSDLLFRFEAVLSVLQEVLHPLIPGADWSEAGRLHNVAKEQDANSRNLEEAQAYYSDPSRRTGGFSAAELRYMEGAIDADLMGWWGYDAPAAAGAG